jgi:FlaA1/EpsC-like NDP-sugar epimerase
VFLLSLAVSSESLTWPSFAEVLVIRIKVANLFLFAGYLILCSGVFSVAGFYRSHRLSNWHRRVYEILFAVTFITAVPLALRWPLTLAFATNEFLALFWLLAFGTLLLSRGVARWLMRLARLRERNLRNVIIVGEEPYATALADRIRQEAHLGYRILRIIDARGIAEDGRTAGDIRA